MYRYIIIINVYITLFWGLLVSIQARAINLKEPLLVAVCVYIYICMYIYIYIMCTCI